MALLPEYVKNLYEEQQIGKNTDCSFEFDVVLENGETTKKVIHGHKFVLSAASDFFTNNLKPEWEQNKPILIKKCKHSVFEKLIKAIYLAVIVFKNIEEACELYEAAHLYCIEGVLRLLRDEIIRYWLCLGKSEKEKCDISSIVNLSFTYGDDKLKHFFAKVFAHHWRTILFKPDFLNYSIEAINSFYQMSDLGALDDDLCKVLEKYIKTKNIDKVKLLPAIDAINFQFVHRNSFLLSDMENSLLQKRLLLKYRRATHDSDI